MLKTSFARRPTLLASIVMITLLPLDPCPSGATEIQWQDWELEAFDGARSTGQLGSIEVPMRRSLEGSASLTLHFARLPARSDVSGPPIVYLDGGPGSSPIRLARVPVYRRLFERLREVGDVILLDQRGVGLSSPGLSCKRPDGPPPLDVFLLTSEQRDQAIDQVARCGKELAARGIDLLAFTTEESADDVDSLRKALAVDQFSILGFSYGTHLGLSVLRRHPDAVASAVLVGVEGPDNTRKLPSTLDTQFAKVSRLIAQDSGIGREVPDFFGLTKRVLERLDRTPAMIPARIRDRDVQIPVSGNGLRLILKLDLGDASDLPFFPALLQTIDAGDYSLLAFFVEKRVPMLVGGTRALYWAMDAASGASPDRWSRIRREEEGAILGSVGRTLFPEVGDRLGIETLPATFRSPVVSDVPTLFVSGTLDSNAPPYQAETARWGFTDAVHLVVENAGHEQLLTDAEVAEIVGGWLAGEVPDITAIRRPAPRFLSIEEAKKERGMDLPLVIGR